MYRIVKTFGPYAAAHQLRDVPEGHKCGNKHGHNYQIEIELESESVDGTGFVVDYGELRAFDEYARARMDHRDLNEQFSFNPTAENLARHFFDWIAGTQSWPVAAVRVSETPGKTVSEYRRPSRATIFKVFSAAVEEWFVSAGRQAPPVCFSSDGSRSYR
jgi:6-pyruvoyltetrahydropterin/6-carboxytetrahydropterin synthase